jgi:hypothetical protein
MDMRLAAAACFGGLLFSACASVKPSRPEAAVFTPVDCATLYPHPGSAPDLEPAAPTPPPAELAASGEAHLTMARFLGCVEGNAEGDSKHLSAVGKQLQYDKAGMATDLASYLQRDEVDGAAREQYQAECTQPNLPPAQYQACLQRSQDLNAEIAAVNQVNSGLKQRNDALNARIDDYDQHIAAASAAVKDSYAAYDAAVRSEGSWMDRARYLVNSPEYRAPATAAGCPDAMTPPKTVDAMHELAGTMIACLKRLPASP